MSKIITVLGATGNIGSKLSHILLQQGHKVLAVGRNASKLSALRDAGAEIAEGDLLDQAFLTSLFQRSDAAFILIPPKFDAADFPAYQDEVGQTIVNAIKESGLRQVVHLSSHGADQLDKKIGPIRGVGKQEQRLNAIEGLNVVHLRPTYFMENTLANLPMLQQGDVVYGGLKPETKSPMIATADIAARAAEILASEIKGKSHQLLLGDREYSQTEVASIMGAALGKPHAQYVQVPYEAVAQGMRQFGIGESTISQYGEMYEGLETQGIFEKDARTPENTTPTSFETFMQQVLAHMHQPAQA